MNEFESLRNKQLKAAGKNLAGRPSTNLLPQMREAMAATGYTRVTELWRDFKKTMQAQQQDIALSYQHILDLTNGEGCFADEGATYSKTAELMATFLGMHPQDLFGALPSDPRAYDIDPDQVACIDRTEGLTQPEDHMLQREREKAIQKCFRQLDAVDENGAEILRLRYGLENGSPMTLDEIAVDLDISRTRVRDLEARASAKLRALLVRGYADSHHHEWPTITKLHI